MAGTNNPHFVLFPTTINRTAYKPFPLPVIYIERHRLDSEGRALANSETEKLRYYIADAPEQARVAGPFNTNLRVPDTARFELNFRTRDLPRYQFDPTSRQFFRRSIDEEGNEIFIPIDFEDANPGDFFNYQLEGSGVVDKVQWFPDAFYYDFSTIEINVDELPRPERWLFIWEATYKNRIISSTGELVCISDDSVITDISLEVAHPGEVMEAMFNGTPALYFNYAGFDLKTDPTIEFYRPYSDLLQDIFDEQELLDGINQIDFIQAEHIPYLAFLIGWDLPNYPGATELLRRQILRRATFLQKNKGSVRAINELFDIFGFTIDIFNLWASEDGNKFLGEDSGFETADFTQVDMALANYDVDFIQEQRSTEESLGSFGVGDVPLTFNARRDSDIVIYAYQVEKDSFADDTLSQFSKELSEDLNSKNDPTFRSDSEGILTPKSIIDLNNELFSMTSEHDSGEGVIGHTRVVVGERVDQLFGRQVINKTNISFDRLKNLLTLFFDHNLSVDGGNVYTYVVYKRHQVIVPQELKNTRTNKFDIQILQNDLEIDFELFNFLVDYLFDLKAFHSLLRKIKFSIEETEVYNTIDCCLDGSDINEPGTCLGDLQVPPAKLIEPPEECADNSDLGYSEEDLVLRDIIFNGLQNEFESWKELEEDCGKTPEGQNRVFDTFDGDLDHEEDPRETYCEDSPELPDYCFKGRIEQTVEQQFLIPLEEIYHCSACGPKLGKGLFWEDKVDVSLDNQNAGLLYDSLVRISRTQGNTLLYTQKSYFDINLVNNQNNLALTPESLDIQKDNLGFPSHRFLKMGRLEEDFNYTQEYAGNIDIYRKRPWDEIPDCGVPTNELNATLTVKSPPSAYILSSECVTNVEYNIFTSLYSQFVEGPFSTQEDAINRAEELGFFVKQELSWDLADLIYAGNDLVSDIESLSEHTYDPNSKTITHNLYQDTLEPTDAIIDDFDLAPEPRVDVDNTPTGPIYKSFCEPDNSDYYGGYSSRYDYWPIDDINYRWIDKNDELDRESLAASFGLPIGDQKTEAGYFAQSELFITEEDTEYKHYIPYRVDCGCLNYDCSPGGTEGINDQDDLGFADKEDRSLTARFDVNELPCPITCNSNALFDRLGKYDPHCDKVELDIAIVLVEQLTLCDRLNNNDLNSTFCVNEECLISETPQGSYNYKDSYGIINEGTWILTGNVLDIEFTTKDPRIPGEEPQGFVDGIKVFRRGIITTTRQIFLLADGEVVLLAEGIEQEIDFYQSNVVCDEPLRENPFPYDVDCAAQANLEFIYNYGPRWTEPGENEDILSDGSTFPYEGWANVIVDSGGNVMVGSDSGHHMMWTEPGARNPIYPKSPSWETL